MDFRGTRVGDPATPAPAEALDTEAAARGDRVGLPRDGDPAAVELTLTTAEPEIDDADVQEALDDFANPAMSAPVTLLFDDSRIRLSPARLRATRSAAEAARRRAGPRPRPRRRSRGCSTPGSAAASRSTRRCAIVDGEPRVDPRQAGRDLPTGRRRARRSSTWSTKPSGKREQRIEAVSAPADFTTADARALEITERVSTFTTYFPYADYRNVNIGRAAEIVDGTILEPDEIFSLNDIVGERTVENGFTEGYVISDGILVTDLGGGVSQMATTTFNAMFFAGLEDVEHKPHSFYIDRYPVGREATVAWGSVDLRFRNDTAVRRADHRRRHAEHALLARAW